MGHMEYRVYPLKLYAQRLPVIIMMAGVSALNIFSWLWLFFKVPRNIDQVFLHYNILFGVDKIGERGEVYYTPLIGLAIMAVNFIIAWIIYKKDWFFSYTLLGVAVVVNIFVAIASVLVVFLNI